MGGGNPGEGRLLLSAPTGRARAGQLGPAGTGSQRWQHPCQRLHGEEGAGPSGSGEGQAVGRWPPSSSWSLQGTGAPSGQDAEAWPQGCRGPQSPPSPDPPPRSPLGDKRPPAGIHIHRRSLAEDPESPGSQQPSGQVERDHHVDDPAGGHEDPEEQAEEHQRAGLARGLLSLGQVSPGQGHAGLQRDQRSGERTQTPRSPPGPSAQAGQLTPRGSQAWSRPRLTREQQPSRRWQPSRALAAGLTHIRTPGPIPHHPHNPDFSIIVGPSLKMRKQRLREVK